jgi:hypothetical protein
MLKLHAVLFTFVICASLRAECVPGGLAVIVPKSSPTDALSVAQLRKLVMGDVHTWPDKTEVMLIGTDPEGAVFKCVLNAVVRMSTPEYRNYLTNAAFRGDQPLRLKIVDSSASALKLVAGAAAGTFAIIEANSVTPAAPVPAAPVPAAPVKVLAIDGKRPGEPGYPL